MNASCSLSTYRIIANRIVHICDPNCPSDKAALRPDHGTVDAIRTKERWLVIPSLGNFGLPLHEKEGAWSWRRVWDDEAVELFQKKPEEGWQQIEAWEKIDATFE